MSPAIAGIKIPDSKMARDLTELIRDKEPDLLFHHSSRVFLFGALTGQRRGVRYDAELLYVGAMFHDIALTEAYRDSQLRFEVDGSNAARNFLRSYGLPEESIETVWTAIALHTTPGIPEHMNRRWRWLPRVSKWMFSESLMISLRTRIERRLSLLTRVARASRRTSSMPSTRV